MWLVSCRRQGNNKLGMTFVVQMRQSDKCGSLQNDEIMNFHLGSGAGL